MAKSGYDVYLKDCLLPVTPDKLQITINNANKTVTLINEGQINILKKAELTDIEFECEIPQVQYPFAVYKSGFQGASYFLEYFEDLKTSKKPFQFIVSRKLPSGTSLFNTNIKVSMEDFKIIEEAKNGYDLTIKIKLKQYREYATKIVNIKISSAKAQASIKANREVTNSPSSKLPTTYSVEKNDCLCGIAKNFYGNSSKYAVIYNANKSVIGGNPNRIYAGQKLTIPKV